MNTNLWSFFVIRHVIRERVTLCPELRHLIEAGFILNVHDVEAKLFEPIWGLGSCLARFTLSRDLQERVGIRVFENATFIVAKDETAVRVGMIIEKYPSFQVEKAEPDVT